MGTKFVGEDIHILYIIKHHGCKRITWRCTKERSLKCRGTMYITDLEIGHSAIGKVHSHIADKHEINNFF